MTRRPLPVLESVDSPVKGSGNHPNSHRALREHRGSAVERQLRTFTRQQEHVFSYLWHKGDLSYKLYEHQLEIYFAYWSAIDGQTLEFASNISRRYGKSFIAMLVAVEYALRFPNSVIKFATSTQLQMGTIVRPLLRVLFQDCPRELLPDGYPKNNVLTFHNGSEITFAGADLGNADRLRGTSSHLNFVDEAGTVSDLEYLINDVLRPMQLTVDGTMIVYGTPAPALDHYWTEYFRKRSEAGQSITRTINDVPLTHISEAKRKIFCEESGGETSTTWQREYLARWVNDVDLMIVPEWNEQQKTAVQAPVEDLNRQYYHKYVALDLGIRDFTAALFGYYDFKRAKLVIQAEHQVSGPQMTTDDLVAALKAKEGQLWGHDPKPVYRRVSDNNNLLLLNDLTTLHGYPVGPVKKELLQAMVNELRLWVKQGRLEVDPSCEYLIGNLKHAYWDDQRRAFSRSDRYKHFDHLAALIYLVRVIDESTNPLPDPARAAYDSTTHYRHTPVAPEENALSRALLGRRQEANLTPYQRFKQRTR